VKVELRPYQDDAIDRVRSELRKPAVQNVLVVAPTGAGKTVIASAIMESAIARGRRVVFLAHRKELIDQCSKKLDQFGVDHGVIQANHPRRRPHLKMHVASVPTLVRRLAAGKVHFSEAPDLIIIDECHRALASSYLAILQAWPKAIVLGLTATPWRTDGRGLGRIYQSMVLVSTVQELVDNGYLLAPTFYAPSRPDLSKVTVRAGDYSEEQLQSVMDTDALVGNIVEHWQKLAGGTRSVVFASGIRHSQHIVERFVAAGIRAEHIDGETPAEARDAILARLRSGETRVVSNCAVLTEGWDLPELGCCVLARPTKSQGLYLQMIGRVMRTIEGKESAIVIDHAGSVLQHGFPTDPIKYSLDDNRRAMKQAAEDDEQQALICPDCNEASPRGTKKCPGCGYEWVTLLAKEPPPEIAGELQKLEAEAACQSCGSKRVSEIRSERLGRFNYGLKCKACSGVTWRIDRAAAKTAGMAEKAAEYERLDEIRKAKGFAHGWTSHKYREVFGVWPRGVRGSGNDNGSETSGDVHTGTHRELGGRG
jgi:DNA repair protein RadD